MTRKEKEKRRKGSEKVARYRKRHPERVLEQARRYYRENRKSEQHRHRLYGKKNRVRLRKLARRAYWLNWKREQARNKEYRLALKRDVLENYGGVLCACCGEKEIMLLTIDHIKGGGNAHRRRLGVNAAGFYRWLKKKKYPRGFQVLCWNCNRGRWIGKGICPHELTRRKGRLA